MSASEVVWRSARAARAAVPHDTVPGADACVLDAGAGSWDRVLERFRESVDRPVVLDGAAAAAVEQACPAQVRVLVESAEQVLRGRVTFFGRATTTLDARTDWHLDPVAGVRWPRSASHRIDHRSGDPKWIWELNRLQYLPWLAEAWLHTGRDEFADRALDLLDSWIEDNPPGSGIAWQNPFEVGVRSISIGLAVQGLRHSPSLTVERFERIGRLLAASADWCWRHRSRFSSANNHLVGEMAGLAVIAMLMPELEGASRWRARALGQLSTEAAKQILADGAGAEQSVAYQVFTCELLLLVAALSRATGSDVPPQIAAAIDRSADFLAALVGDGDPVPRNGDDDEGFALRLDSSPVRTVAQHLGIVAAFAGRPRLPPSDEPTLTSAWIAELSRRATLPRADPPCVAPATSFYAPNGGLVVLRSGGRRLMMDIGPLGYLSIAAHGHADALAVDLSLDHQQVIGDPGAGSYYRHPDRRAAHRSTLTHATVTVDGEPQSVMTGPFLWSRHARVTTRTVDLRRGVVDAQHDGYRRLPGRVMHRRWLVAPPGSTWIVVVDLVEGAGEHDVCVSWPLHPTLDVQVVPDGYAATRDDVPVLQLATAATVPVTLDRVRGDEHRNLGWWAERLEERVPSWLLMARLRGAPPMVSATVLRPLRDGARTPITGVRLSTDATDISVAWLDDGLPHGVVVDSSRAGAAQMGALPTPEVTRGP